MIDSCWPSIAVVAILILSGYGLLACLQFKAASGPERFGLAFASGTAWLGFLTITVGALGFFSPLVIIPLLLLPTLGLLKGVRGERKGKTASNSAMRAWIGFFPVLPLVLLSFWFALQRPVWSIDALRRWVLHAQWTADEFTPVPERIESPEWADAHPSYPPLVSAVLALSLQLGGDRDEGLRIVFPTYLLALLCVLYGYARRRAPPLVATCLTLVLATTPCFSVLDAQAGSYGLGADTALADIPLALFLTALAALVLDALSSGGASATSRWRLAAIVGIGAVLTKNEGMLFAPLMIGMSALVACFVPKMTRLGSARRALVGLTSVLVLTGLLWKWVARDMTVRAGEEYLSAGVLSSLSAGFERALAIGERMFAQLADTGLWGVLWLCPLIWCIWYVAQFSGFTREQRIRRALPFLWVLASLCMVFGAYVATGWKNGAWERLMDVSLARLLIHHAPLALILVCDLFQPEAERDALDAESSETLAPQELAV
ncbi:MAG: hypothetical protein ACI8TQ_000539 [Planctomycetota bacterium]|jgi:hypothetical protein